MSVERWLVAIGILLAAPSAEAAFVRGPYPQDLSARGASLLFELDAPHAVKLSVARGGGPTIKTTDGAKDTAHELAISGLEPATTYDWTLSVDDGTTEKGSFTTAPVDDRTFTFLLYGDNRTNPYAHATLVERMQKTPGDFLVNTGDMVYDGSQAKEWLSFFAIEKALLRERCLFPTIGNHEIAMPTSEGAQRYARVFRVPAPIDAAERWYTFRWGSARFFVLDAQDEFATTERAWLEKSLTEADAEPGLVFRFAVLHHGPYSSGLHGGNESMIVTRVPELLKAHKVDLVFSGHDHAYERGDANGLRYIVSGGGGAPLYREHRNEIYTKKFEAAYHFLSIEVAKTAVTLTTIRLDGSTIERCSLAAGGLTSWSCGEAPPVAPMPSTIGAAPTPPSAAPPPSPAPEQKKSCGCDVIGASRGWLGLLLIGLVSGAMMLRRGREAGRRE
ncbi:MAG: metallophosphoesterase family protein [Polyangiales bacterium]